MKMYSKDGIEMMQMKKISREGANLVMNSKVMGSMSMSVYLRPEDLWQSKSLLPWSVLWYLPVILCKGFWRSMRMKKK